MIQDGDVVSRGIAIVQYEEKDQAAKALRGLPFDRSLGEMIEIDFYQSKESRMVTLE